MEPAAAADQSGLLHRQAQDGSESSRTGRRRFSGWSAESAIASVWPVSAFCVFPEIRSRQLSRVTGALAPPPFTMGYLGVARACTALSDLSTDPAVIDTGVAVLRK